MSEGTRTLANRYSLGEAIGRGGMGVVHRARDLQLDRAVAVKVVSDDADAVTKERFLTEARRTASVRHPSIVEVFDVGEDHGDVFLVMELLEGDTLSARIAREGGMPASEVVSVAGEICDALIVAHDAGLVHRDLKPDNVFLLASPTDGRRVKLLDFGIAKRIDGATARTDANMLVGTLEYMSPEQVRGDRLDGRSDLYALGMTLYRMLVGAPAFSADNAAALVHQQMNAVPMSPRVRAADRGIPAWLDALVMRLLQKDPPARPASAREVKTLLAAADAGAPGVPAATTATAPVTGGGAFPRAGMQMVELDDELQPAPSIELELDRGTPSVASRPPPAGALVPQAHRWPDVVPPQAPLAPPAAPLPAWLEPLAAMPIALSKRVTGYSLFALAVYVVFFNAAWGPALMLLTVASVGAVATWAAWRASR